MNEDDYLVYNGEVNLRNFCKLIEKLYPEYCEYLVSKLGENSEK